MPQNEIVHLGLLHDVRRRRRPGADEHRLVERIGNAKPWLPLHQVASSGITSTSVRRPSFFMSTFAIARPLGQSSFGSKNSSHGS